MFFLTFLVATKSTFLNTWIPLLSAALSGGILGTIASLRNRGVERESFVASATKQAVEIFESSIASLRADLADAQEEARGLTEELARARKELSLLQKLRTDLEAEVGRLRSRVTQLENKLNKN